MVRPIERVSSYDDVVAATGGDPYARWTVDPSERLAGGARDGAVAWTVRREHYAGKPWLNALGAPEAAAALVTDLLTDGAGALDPLPRGITVPIGTLDMLPPDLRPPEHGDWTWWWTDTTPPAEAAEPEVVDLLVADDAIRAEVADLLRVASPAASAEVDDPGVRTWCGIRDASGRLVACAADRPMHGVPHLASIATHPDARGRGYGGAVTAWLVRRRLIDDEAAVVTLGMYSDNDSARSVYLRLGLRPEHRFTSGDLPPPPPARTAPS